MIQKKKVGSKVKFAFLILFFLSLIIFAVHLERAVYGHSNESMNIKDFFNDKFGYIYFALIYTTISFLPVPVAPTFFLGALLFPISKAFFYTMLGMIVSTTLMFYLARFLGKDFVDEFLSKRKKAKDFERRIEKKAFLNIFLLRLFFIIPSEFISLGSGLLKIRFREYFLATLLANIPIVFLSSAMIRGLIRHNDVVFNLALGGLIIIGLVSLFFLRRLGHDLKFTSGKTHV